MRERFYYFPLYYHLHAVLSNNFNYVKFLLKTSLLEAHDIDEKCETCRDKIFTSLTLSSLYKVRLG